MLVHRLDIFDLSKYCLFFLDQLHIRYFRVSSWLLSLCHHPTGCVGKICIWITNICMHMRLWSNCTQKSDIDESKRSPTSNGFIPQGQVLSIWKHFTIAEKQKDLFSYVCSFIHFLFQIKKSKNYKNLDINVKCYYYWKLHKLKNLEI